MFVDGGFTQYWWLFFLGLYAGTQNFLAGGGTFITYPVLIGLGVDPVVATMTSMLGLYPNQIGSAWTSRSLAQGVPGVRLGQLVVISLLGGWLGAWLLVTTPSSLFGHIVPWLMIGATIIFVWGGTTLRSRQTQEIARGLKFKALCFQGLIATYGGYFTAGMGFLMLALLRINGQEPKAAIATKNVLAFVLGSASTLYFISRSHPRLDLAFWLATGAIFGSWTGRWLLDKLSNRFLKGYIFCLGSGLSVWLLYTQYQ